MYFAAISGIAYAFCILLFLTRCCAYFNDIVPASCIIISLLILLFFTAVQSRALFTASHILLFCESGIFPSNFLFIIWFVVPCSVLVRSSFLCACPSWYFYCDVYLFQSLLSYLSCPFLVVCLFVVVASARRAPPAGTSLTVHRRR